MSPNCGGTSFEGRVSDLKMAPVLGSALGRVPKRVRTMVAAVQYQRCLSLSMIAVSVRSHLSPILMAVAVVPGGGGGSRWWQVLG